jgi:HPt (histidine-containing phosphotransfer) domain-containing protein
MNETPIVDRAVVDDLIDHIGAEAVATVVDLFLNELYEFVRAIGGVANRTDDAARREQARRAAHSLKSSAGQIGAAALAEAALAVETAAGTNAPDLTPCAIALIECAAATTGALAEFLPG